MRTAVLPRPENAKSHPRPRLLPGGWGVGRQRTPMDDSPKGSGRTRPDSCWPRPRACRRRQRSRCGALRFAPEWTKSRPVSRTMPPRTAVQTRAVESPRSGGTSPNQGSPRRRGTGIPGSHRLADRRHRSRMPSLARGYPSTRAPAIQIAHRSVASIRPCLSVPRSPARSPTASGPVRSCLPHLRRHPATQELHR